MAGGFPDFRDTDFFDPRVTSSVNSRVKKIGVSEIRKSAGHFSDSFTQRTSASYFSDRKAALKAERRVESTRRSRQRYIKNLPSRITCWPLNQMSKSRPTQSICVLEAQFAPVCSA